MFDAEVVSELLELVSNPAVAKKRGKELQSLRGVRGVPHGEIARISSAIWKDNKPTLEDDGELSALFGTAWEDGLVAIGLLATLLSEGPDEVLDLARDWAERIDDHQTADAVGTLLLGPAALLNGGQVAKQLGSLLRHRRPEVRRAAVMAGLALVPEEITGPAVAPLRAQLGAKGVVFVEHAQSAEIAQIASISLRDEHPSVRKALRRVLGSWAQHDPDAAERWLGDVVGGTPKILKEAIQKGVSKGRRKAAKQAQWLKENPTEVSE